jgi:importin subunit alpha-1
MCDLLNSMDNKIIQVALDGLENILKVGDIDKEAAGPGATNQYAQFIEEAGGMVNIHNLQHHENLEIYKKCFYIMDSESLSALSRRKLIVEFFPDDDEEEADGAAPAVDASGQYAFQSDGEFGASVTRKKRADYSCRPSRWFQLWLVSQKLHPGRLSDIFSCVFDRVDL